MGYSNYWQRINSGSQSDYKRALIDCRKIISNNVEILADVLGQGSPVFDDQISINGIDQESHETFFLPAHFADISDFEFCKTARKSYDIIVVALLAVLKYHMGESICVTSDGGRNDWNKGVALASKVLQTDIPNPILTE